MNEQDENDEENKEKPFRKNLKTLGSPHLQLNLASDHVDDRHQVKHAELLLAAAAALLIQGGLIVLAVMTTSYSPLRKQIGFQPKVDGLPCYVAGSMLLCWVVGFCSYVVKRKAEEVSWTVSRHPSCRQFDTKPEYHHPTYVQTNQTVNDQTFDAYILHAGRRSKVLASSRHDNSQHGGSRHSDSRYGGSNNNELGWEWATVVAAGMGFTAQFMGLRGLTYPSPIAQILAIVVMTVIRAVIRRRLEPPAEKPRNGGWIRIRSSGH